MRKFFVFLIFLAFVFASCDQPTAEVSNDPAIEDPISDDQPVIDQDPWQYDERLHLVDAASTKWLRKPGGVVASDRGIADGDPVAAYCTDPGWSYIFYDDMAVIGYEPFPDNATVMHAAVAITVELHNRDNPGAEWDYINVAIPVIPPDTSNDPILEVWQYALCIDDGTIVDGPYTAEFDFNWLAFKSGGAALQLEAWNKANAPIVAHIVWGPDA